MVFRSAFPNKEYRDKLTILVGCVDMAAGRATINQVLDLNQYYSHFEIPRVGIWIALEVRRDVPRDESCYAILFQKSMKKYYSGRVFSK